MKQSVEWFLSIDRTVKQLIFLAKEFPFLAPATQSKCWCACHSHDTFQSRTSVRDGVFHAIRLSRWDDLSGWIDEIIASSQSLHLAYVRA